jgi:hypothetical protein
LVLGTRLTEPEKRESGRLPPSALRAQKLRGMTLCVHEV